MLQSLKYKLGYVLCCNSSKWEADLRSGGLLNTFHYTVNQRPYLLSLPTTLLPVGNPGEAMCLKGVYFDCEIYPAAQSASDEQWCEELGHCEQFCG
jgi:hypothetical protein